MSAREWKPGDVATVTDPVDGDLIAIRIGDDPSEQCWHAARSNGDLRCLAADQAADVRPLVVLDPEDREQVARLADAFCDARWSHLPDSDECDPLTRSSMQAALREFANPTPPKPAEPTGLGAVVEDAEGVRWVLACGPDCPEADDHCEPWMEWNGDDSRTFDNIAVVRVLSEGVTPC